MICERTRPNFYAKNVTELIEIALSVCANHGRGQKERKTDDMLGTRSSQAKEKIYKRTK